MCIPDFLPLCQAFPANRCVSLFQRNLHPSRALLLIARLLWDNLIQQDKLSVVRYLLLLSNTLPSEEDLLSEQDYLNILQCFTKWLCINSR
jgi:hypothetical protein